jgi:SAM-dependent methyltransferase
MADNFNRYAEYYNLIYDSKNYSKEADFIDTIIRKNNPTSKTLCDLGCGTGKYSICLESKGYTVLGIDLSEDMIRIAKNYEHKNLKFLEGNIINFSLKKSFDVIVAMFDVVSYINSNDDFIRMLSSVREHLNEEGIFIFDFWYGPGVLTNLPETRYKEFKNDNILIKRISRPMVEYSTNIVDVEFDLFVFDKKNEFIEHINEIHKMRYFFKNELEYLIKTVFPNSVIEFTNWENNPEIETTWHTISIIKTNK